MQCSPSRKHLKDSCLTFAELKSVASLFNKDASLYNLKPIPMESFSSRTSLLKQLKQRFDAKCKGAAVETCWLKQDVLKSHAQQLYNALDSAYRPPKPSSWATNDREWLNTLDILKVMQQYDNDKFEFLGVHPVDFAKKSNNACIVQKMCNFSVSKFRSSGKTSFGLILNLDRHDQPGSHWVACYCSMDPASPKYGICYYDSGGDEPPQDILDFIKDVWTEVDDPDRFQKKYNPTQHQFQDTECGVFSMLFITLCIEHPVDNYRAIRKRVKAIASDKSDDKIHKFRDVFYRSEE